MSTMQQTTGKSWSLILAQGIALIILGLLLVSAPAAALLFLVTVLGIYWLVSGIFSIVRIVTGDIKVHWFWALLVGFLGIAAGLIVLRHPLYSSILVPALLVIILGIDGLIMGVVNLIRGFAGDGTSVALIGVLDIIFGAILISSPLLGAAILPVIIGIIAIVGGIGFIAFSLTVQPMQKTLREEYRKAA